MSDLLNRPKNVQDTQPPVGFAVIPILKSAATTDEAVRQLMLKEAALLLYAKPIRINVYQDWRITATTASEFHHNQPGMRQEVSSDPPQMHQPKFSREESRLARSCSKALSFLSASLPETQGSTWPKAINDIQTLPRPTKTIVGIVGNTGFSKTSVANALLDEERLLPTNCVRACNAFPTKISYNHSENPKELYRSKTGLFVMLA
ncbi:hypothetical protein LY78DRAFT_684025 [Colletotrichum sublineola]|nr:hypothetical protein LY78DRAFT_684025 [Colletotrichum sublineola]